MFSLDIENIDETYFGQEAFPCSVEVNKNGRSCKSYPLVRHNRVIPYTCHAIVRAAEHDQICFVVIIIFMHLFFVPHSRLDVNVPHTQTRKSRPAVRELSNLRSWMLDLFVTK